VPDSDKPHDFTPDHYPGRSMVDLLRHRTEKLEGHVHELEEENTDLKRRLADIVSTATIEQPEQPEHDAPLPPPAA